MIESKKLTLTNNYPITFSICTFVTRPEEYERMKNSFLENGYLLEDIEFLYFDNSNKSDNVVAFEGINYFLQNAKGKYIIICHQDIEIIDSKDKLVSHINEVESLDKNWGLISNAGGYAPNKVAYYVSYPDKGLERKGNFPQKVFTADENFLLVKNNSNLCVSKDLAGFHFYGTDLCMICQLLGYSCWAISYNILHKSRGTKDASFWLLRKSFKNKYSNYFRSRWIQTTSSPLYISGNYFDKIFVGSRLILNLKKLFKNK